MLHIFCHCLTADNPTYKDSVDDKGENRLCVPKCNPDNHEFGQVHLLFLHPARHLISSHLQAVAELFAQLCEFKNVLLHLCMYTNIYLLLYYTACIDIRVYVFMWHYVLTYVCTNICMYLHVYSHTYVCTYVCTYMDLLHTVLYIQYICMYAYLYNSTYVCIPVPSVAHASH